MRLGIDSNSNPTFKIGKFLGYYLPLVPDTEVTVAVPVDTDTRGLQIVGVLINHSKAVDLLYKNHPTDPISVVVGATESQALNPSLRSVKPGDTLRFRSPLASEVQLEWLFEESTVWNK